MKSEFKKVHGAGPGGLTCTCCRPAAVSNKVAVGLQNKRFRRSAYAIIREQAEEIEIYLAGVRAA